VTFSTDTSNNTSTDRSEVIGRIDRLSIAEQAIQFLFIDRWLRHSTGAFCDEYMIIITGKP